MSEHLLLTQWCYLVPYGTSRRQNLVRGSPSLGICFEAFLPVLSLSLPLSHTHIYTFLIFFLLLVSDRMWSLCFLMARLPSHSLLSWFPYSVSLELECILFYIAYGYGTVTPTYFLSTFIFSYIQNWKQGYTGNLHPKFSPDLDTFFFVGCTLTGMPCLWTIINKLKRKFEVIFVLYSLIFNVLSCA